MIHRSTTSGPAPRSILYVPASRPEMIAKLPGLPADAVLLDLEDGVPPGGKGAARAHLRNAASEGTLAGHPRWMLRVNAPDGPWHDADLDLAAELRPAVTVMPKAEDPERVRRLARRCAAWGGLVGLMIETARGLVGIHALARSHPAVDMLIYGSADYMRSTGALPDETRAAESLALQQIVLAARAAGCRAVDAVYFRFRDDEGLRAHARVARGLGFDGKSCIHPRQVGPIHEVFASTPDELAWARGALRAWEEQDGASRGVVVSNGEMIEALHLEIARRILARASGPARDGPKEYA